MANELNVADHQVSQVSVYTLFLGGLGGAVGNLDLFVEQLRQNRKHDDGHTHTSVLLTQRPGRFVLREK